MKFAFSFWKNVTYYLGRMIRETGLALDHHGSRLTKDIAYLEPTSRHRTFMNLFDLVPKVLDKTFVAPNSTIVGEVIVGRNSAIWYGATLRGDNAAVRVGNNTSIGDYSVLETVNALNTGIPCSVNIGNNVNLGPNCSLYSCVIDDFATVGARTVIAEGAVLERGCMVGPNSYVPPGKLIPAYQLWEGTPVTFVRDLNENERKNLDKNREELLVLGQEQEISENGSKKTQIESQV